MSVIATKALHQPGFAFERTSLFKRGKLAKRFYASVIGPINGVSSEGLRLGVERRLKAIFLLCLQHREFYLAVDGSSTFWRLVSEQWDTLEHVDPEEAAAFVRACQAARERCDSDVPTGELSDMVDDFIEIHRIMMALRPAHHFQITLRPSRLPQEAPTTTSLAPGNATLGTASPWPPTYFTEQEVAWFSHDHLLPQLYGLTPSVKITKAVDFPRIPDAYTHPLDVRLFLAFTSLSNLGRDRRVSLCMTPITFWDDDERKDWHLATGGASKLCWTTWEFCRWAKDEFSSGREAVVGLCHFHCVAQDNPWKCVGILIRKVGWDNYEFIMEDAHYHRVSSNPDYYEQKYDLYPNSGMDFKSALLQDVLSHFNVTSFWHGGEVPNAFENFGICLTDSVSTSCSFVVLAVQGKIPIEGLDEEEWAFSRGVPQKMRYWKSEDEEQEHKPLEVDFEVKSEPEDTEMADVSEYEPSEADYRAP
ncbi:hypothetical protein F5X98DRAFT_380627 [Xylaria grammica]|nr:hypothetical protein F5X98DRAFT_380627 [Xylaria grammica]